MACQRLPSLYGLGRSDIAAVIRGALPWAAGAIGDDAFSGGRRTALGRLAVIDPVAYGRSRNFLDGAVTRLSPWIRHGVLSLAEVRDAAVERAGRNEDAAKLVSELGWRDYWRRVHARIGDRVWEDLEPPAAEPMTPWHDEIPADVLAAATGMPCIDAFVQQLHETGWLHNHARMWLSSWLVHFRGVHWRAGAAWFLEHLLDGDPASNNLSWQWVAGTFSSKPYIFNRENLEHYTAGVHCRDCPLLGRCEVEGSYEELASRLFRQASGNDPRPKLRIEPALPWRAASVTREQPAPPGTATLVWLTLDSASNTSPAVKAFPGSPRLFVLDPAWIESESPTLKRLVFLFECLAEIPQLSVVLGDPEEAVTVEAAAVNAGRIAIADTPCPRIRRQSEAISRRIGVDVVMWPRFVDDRKVDDITRFSRYWRRVERSAMEPTPDRPSPPDSGTTA